MSVWRQPWREERESLWVRERCLRPSERERRVFRVGPRVSANERWGEEEEGGRWREREAKKCTRAPSSFLQQKKSVYL